MNGLDIVRRVFERLRKPSDTALPYQTALNTVREVIAMKKLDLAMSDQNSLAATSDWFTPSGADFEISEIGADNILLPVRLESLPIDSELERGMNVPLVNYEVLDTSKNGAASFYGFPMRIVFSDTLDTIQERKYRLIYETDFNDAGDLPTAIALPDYFAAMVAVEACYQLVDLVEDDGPEFANFAKSVTPKWLGEISRWEEKWKKYVYTFKGKAQVPKRTMFDNSSYLPRTRYFKG